jgi:hypothetical protein
MIRRIQPLKMSESGLVSSAVDGSFVLNQTGELTRLEVLTFILAHTRRHIHQLEKIAQDHDVITQE